MSTEEKTATVLDAETIAELQPPCDNQRVVNHVPQPPCGAPAQYVRVSKCLLCDAETTRLRCIPHTMPKDGIAYCWDCKTHHAPRLVLSIEPLR